MSNKDQELSLMLKIIDKLENNEISKNDLIIYKLIINKSQKTTLKIGDFFTLHQTNFAIKINLKQSNINRSIKRLLNANLLDQVQETKVFVIPKII
jgi:predicted transcriptional regulator